jgi:RNA polymerase sigma factor (sigma-70 family)
MNPPRLTHNRDQPIESLAVEIYSDHRTHLLRIAERNSLNRDDAEESLQEAIIAFIRFYDPGRGAHPLAWLTLVLKRKCWERTRREHLDYRAGQEVEAGDDGPGSMVELIPDSTHGPEVLAELRDDFAQLAGHVAQLKRDERRALSLVAEGYSYQEIIEITGWTYTKVNRCVAEGRARLRRLAANGSVPRSATLRLRSERETEIPSA